MVLTLCFAYFGRATPSALGLVLLAGCSSTPPYPEAPAFAASPDYLYKIGPLDSVNVQVWRNPELSMSVTVRPDGKISAPLIEDLPALGKDPTTLGARHREGAVEVHTGPGRHGNRRRVRRPLSGADSRRRRGREAPGNSRIARA